MKHLLLNIPVSIFREEGAYIAHTPVLDLSTCADSIEGVRRRFGEAVQIFFAELERKGTTGEVLESLGWQKVENQWSAPIEVAHEIEHIEVPIGA